MAGIFDILGMILFLIGLIGEYSTILHIGGLLMLISAAIEIFLKGRVYGFIPLIACIAIAFFSGYSIYLGAYWGASPIALILFSPLIKKIYDK